MCRTDTCTTPGGCLESGSLDVMLTPNVRMMTPAELTEGRSLHFNMEDMAFIPSHSESCRFMLETMLSSGLWSLQNISALAPPVLSLFLSFFGSFKSPYLDKWQQCYTAIKLEKLVGVDSMSSVIWWACAVNLEMLALKTANRSATTCSQLQCSKQLLWRWWQNSNKM